MRRPEELEEHNQALASEVKHLKALVKEKVRPRVQKSRSSNQTIASTKSWETTNAEADQPVDELDLKKLSK